jgi:hypothetical protein
MRNLTLELNPVASETCRGICSFSAMCQQSFLLFSQAARSMEGLDRLPIFLPWGPSPMTKEVPVRNIPTPDYSTATSTTSSVRTVIRNGTIHRGPHLLDMPAGLYWLTPRTLCGNNLILVEEKISTTTYNCASSCPCPYVTRLWAVCCRPVHIDRFLMFLLCWLKKIKNEQRIPGVVVLAEL